MILLSTLCLLRMLEPIPEAHANKFLQPLILLVMVLHIFQPRVTIQAVPHSVVILRKYAQL